MNKTLGASIALWLFAALDCANAGQARAGQALASVKASNPHIMPRGQSVLRYLASLSESAHHGIVSGQWFNGPAAWPKAHELFVDNLYKATGKQPALLGSDYVVALSAIHRPNG